MGFTCTFLEAVLQWQKTCNNPNVHSWEIGGIAWVYPAWEYSLKQRLGQRLGCWLFTWEVILDSSEAGEEDKST